MGSRLTIDRSASRRLLELHDRMLSGDRAASDEIAAALLSACSRRLTRRFSSSSQDLIWDALVEAVMGYLANPRQFDQGRGVTLERFISSVVKYKVVDAYRRDVRRCRREREYVDVHPPVHCTPAERVEWREKLAICEAIAARGLTAPERRAVLNWLVGADGETIAASLGITSLPSDEQRLRIKRLKDMGKKRLRRFGIREILSITIDRCTKVTAGRGRVLGSRRRIRE